MAAGTECPIDDGVARFDVDQLEVFKGSQSTVFGPNSMAGQINVRSADPDEEFGEAVQLTVGSDALQRLSGAVNVPLAESLSARVGMLSARSNGFRENRFLDIEDISSQGQYCLITPLPPLLCRASSGITLNDKDLGLERIPAGTVSQLPGKTSA